MKANALKSFGGAIVKANRHAKAMMASSQGDEVRGTRDDRMTLLIVHSDTETL